MSLLLHLDVGPSTPEPCVSSSLTRIPTERQGGKDKLGLPKRTTLLVTPHRNSKTDRKPSSLRFPVFIRHGYLGPQDVVFVAPLSVIVVTEGRES
jgi:hypothetical protein